MRIVRQVLVLPILAIAALLLGGQVHPMDGDGRERPAGGLSSSNFFGESGALLSRAVQMEGVAGYIEGRARDALRTAISERGTAWMCDAFARAINERRRGGAPNVGDVLRQDAQLKEAVKAELKRRIKEWLPGQVERLIVHDIFGAAAGEEVAREVREIAGRVMREIDTTLGERLDAIAGGMYDAAAADLRRRMVDGTAGVLDITDLEGSVRRALDLRFAANIAADQMGRLMGDATVAGIRGRITDALEGRLPPEVIDALERGPRAFDEFMGRAQRFLPGNALRELTGSVLNRPLIRLPTPAYAAILAASAARHFSRAYSGVFVDPNELRRGIEVTRVMAWQLRNRQSVNLSIMQLGSLARSVASRFGAGEVFDSVVERIREPLDRIQGLADRIDAMIMRPIEQVRNEMRGLVDDIQRGLLALQEELVGPIRNELNRVQGELDRAGDAVIDALPDGFNGLPASWEALKEHLGLDEGELGRILGWRPRDGLEEIAEGLGLDDAAERVREGLGDLNDAVAEKIAAGAAAILERLRLLGPAAKILKVERTPARNESGSSELDPVLTHNGEYVGEVADLVIPGRGIDFRFTRIYRGRSNFLGELGWRWTHSYAERLLPWNDGSGDGLTHIDERGRKFFFRAEGGEFVSPPGIYSKLVRTGSGHEMRSRGGAVAAFDELGRLKEKRDRHGNRLSFIYGEQGFVSTVADAFGRKVKFERREDGLITSIEDFAGRSFRFEYNDTDELIGVTSPGTPDFPKGKTTAYRYERRPSSPATEHALTMIMDPKGGVYLRNRYDGEGRIIAQQYGSGPWMKVEYSGSSDGERPARQRPEPQAMAGGRATSDEIALRTSITDRMGVVRIYEHDDDGHLIKLSRREGDKHRLVVAHRYNEDGERVSTCLPSGRCTLYSYGKGVGRGDIVRVEVRSAAKGEKPRVTEIAREERFGRIASIVDSFGVETKFEYADEPGGEIVQVKKRGADTQEWGALASHRYNQFGQLVESIDGRGVATTYDYYSSSDPDGDGVLAGEDEYAADGGGYLRRIVRDAAERGGRIAEGPPVKQETLFSYDPIGNITAITNPVGLTTRFSVNALNQIIREEEPGRAPRNYRFDANDNLIRVVFDVGSGPIVDEFDYAGTDLVVASRQQVAKGKHIETRYEYDSEGRPISITSPEGNESLYEYDDEGRLVCAVGGATSLERTSSCVARDADGEIVAEADGSGRTTRYERNGFGEVMAVVNPLGDRVELERDAKGRVVGRRGLDAKGKLLSEARFEYDAADNLTAEARGLWLDNPRSSRWITTRWGYDPDGNVISMTDAVGRTSQIVRDGLANAIATIDASGIKTIEMRDALGRVVESYVEGGGHKMEGVKISYGDSGMPEQIDLGGDGIWRYRYDSLGNLAAVIDPYGIERRFEVDDLGRRVAVTDDIGGERIATRYLWSGNGRLKMIVDARGSSTEFGYDDLDRLIIERYADGTERHISYDGADRVTGVLDRNGSALAIAYDAAGRLASRVAVPAEGVAGTRAQRFEYDGLSRLIAAIDENDPADPADDAVSGFIYDSLSRPVAESSGSGWLSRQFDEASNVTVMRTPSKRSIFFAYDEAGRMKSVMNGSRRLGSFEYDVFGNLVKKHLGENMNLEIGYYSDRSVAEMRYQTDTGIGFDAWEYHADGKGRLDFESGGIGEIHRYYKRDSLGRLIDVADVLLGADTEESDTLHSWRYGLDAVGNWLTLYEDGAETKFEANSINVYTDVKSEGGASYSPKYDAAGNLMADGGRGYRYDVFGRLVAVLQGGDVIAQYRYDAFDRRVAKAARGRTKTAVWDGWRLVEEMEEGDIATYVYGNEFSPPFAALSSRGQGSDEARAHYLFSDRMGSVRSECDDTSRVVARCDYSPYGAEVDIAVTRMPDYDSVYGPLWDKPSSTNVADLRRGCEQMRFPFRFAGHIADDETGLIYMRERYYSPKLGRFLTPDPLGYKIPLRTAQSAIVAPSLSYHAGQGGAQHATFPNRSNAVSPNYDVHPFGRAAAKRYVDSRVGVMNLYLYARADPSRFADPLGLASLIFDRSDGKMILLTGGGEEVLAYRASNRATSPSADPYAIGMNGPFPNGTYAVGIPDFYDEEYRQEIYTSFDLGEEIDGESTAGGRLWLRSEPDADGYNMSYGRIRLRAGSRPPGSNGDIAWRRQLFLHGGRRDYTHPTRGCIRMDDLGIEKLAANFIQFRRQGDPVETITVRD